MALLSLLGSTYNPITFYSMVVKFIVSLSNHLTSTGMFLIANFLIAMSRLWFYNQKWLSFRLTFFTFLLGLPEIDVKLQLHSTKKGPSIAYAMTFHMGIWDDIIQSAFEINSAVSLQSDRTNQIYFQRNCQI